MGPASPAGRRHSPALGSAPPQKARTSVQSRAEQSRAAPSRIPAHSRDPGAGLSHSAARAQRPPLQPTLIRFPLVSPALDTEEGKTAPIQARPRED